MTKWTIPGTPSPEAIVRAALERAAEKAANKLEPKRLYTEAQSVSDAIRSLASDPAEVAAILKKAGEDRG
jgi:hypothetical protein